MFGVAPTYFLAHSCIRLPCLILPRFVFDKADDLLWNSYQQMILYFFENMIGTTVTISGYQPKEKENILFICNHQCTVDWIVTDILSVRQSMMGNLRYVFKDGIKYLPLYGYVFGVHDGVYVKRDGSYNQSNMKHILSNNIIKRKRPTYFVIFPEGTRYSIKRKDVLEKSQKFAVDNDLAPLKHVLMPRTKAFQCAVETMRDYITAIYDVTITYDTKQQKAHNRGVRRAAPNMWKFLISKQPTIDIHIDRIPIYSVPAFTSQQETLRWLHGRYQLKDDIISKHYDAGIEGTVSPPALLPNLSCAALWVGSTLFLLSTSTGRKIYSTSLIAGSLYGMVYAKLLL